MDFKDNGKIVEIASEVWNIKCEYDTNLPKIIIDTVGGKTDIFITKLHLNRYRKKLELYKLDDKIMKYIPEILSIWKTHFPQWLNLLKFLTKRKKKESAIKLNYKFSF